MYTFKVNQATVTLNENLEKFLRKERVLTRAVRCIQNDWKSKLWPVDTTIEINDLAEAFVWADTADGNMFWNRLDKEFRKF